MWIFALTAAWSSDEEELENWAMRAPGATNPLLPFEAQWDRSSS